MCEKAVEVQELWKPVVGDYVALSRFPGQGFLLEIKTKGHEARPLYQVEHGFNNQYRSELIWLPRQDQLQDMLKEKLPIFSDKGLTKLLNIFTDSVLLKTLEIGIIRKMSFEQLWLAFVMEEKFNLTWNGEDWEAR